MTGRRLMGQSEMSLLAREDPVMSPVKRHVWAADLLAIVVLAACGGGSSHPAATSATTTIPAGGVATTTPGTNTTTTAGVTDAVTSTSCDNAPTQLADTRSERIAAATAATRLESV